MAKLKKSWWNGSRPRKLYAFNDGDVVCCDALKMLMSLREGVADLIFLDPPFNLGKLYGRKGKKGDLLDEDKYFEYMNKVLDRSCTLLKKGGSLYLYHLPKWAIKFVQILEKKLTFQHWIAISMKNGFARGKKLYPAHYSLLHFSKGSPLSFHRLKIPPQVCRHCAGQIKDYGGYKKFIKKGINLSDVWDDLSPVRHQKYKYRDSNELPLEIPRRVSIMSGRKGGIFIDPFGGSGSSLIAALEMKMNFVACDREGKNITVIKRRLKEAYSKKLKVLENKNAKSI